eukprot:scaffold209559_cov35-Tisochrysis_lutea.AAC.2
MAARTAQAPVLRSTPRRPNGRQAGRAHLASGAHGSLLDCHRSTWCWAFSSVCHNTSNARNTSGDNA